MASITVSQRRLIFLLTVPVWATAMLLVAWRPDGVGADTANYREYFVRSASGWASTLDIGFEVMMRSLSSVTDRPEVFFAVIFLIVTGLMTKAISMATFEVEEPHKILLPVLSAGLLFASSWYIAATLNGLRQGISLSLLYCAIYCLFRRDVIAFVVLSALSISFHVTTIFAVLSLLILVLNFNTIVVVFYLAAVGYVSGVFETLVLVFSNVTGIEIYSAISSYAGGADIWRGSQWNLLIYTLFWPAFYLLVLRVVRPAYRENLKAAISVYCVLCAPYFLLGFGSYSNRFAVMAWLYLPILHAVAIVSANVTWRTGMVISAFMFALGAAKYFGYLFGAQVPY